jgi:hypothetical protein
MSEISRSNYDNELTWIIVISIGLFILSLIFNIFFLINGILSTILGIYYMISINNEINKLNEISKSESNSNLLYGFSLFLSWSVLILGILSIFIYIIGIYTNRNKGAISRNTYFNKNTNRYLKN